MEGSLIQMPEIPGHFVSFNFKIRSLILQALASESSEWKACVYTTDHLTISIQNAGAQKSFWVAQSAVVVETAECAVKCRWLDPQNQKTSFSEWTKIHSRIAFSSPLDAILSRHICKQSLDAFNCKQNVWFDYFEDTGKVHEQRLSRYILNMNRAKLQKQDQWS